MLLKKYSDFDGEKIIWFRVNVKFWKKNSRLARQKKIILTLVSKNHTPPLQVKWSVCTIKLELWRMHNKWAKPKFSKVINY